MEHDIHISFRANPLIVVSSPITSLYIWGKTITCINRTFSNLFYTDKFVFLGLQTGLLQIFNVKQRVDGSSVILFLFLFI